MAEPPWESCSNNESNSDACGLWRNVTVLEALSDALCMLFSLLSQQLCEESAIIITFYSDKKIWRGQIIVLGS